MLCAQGVLLFLILAVNSTRFRILCSYSSQPFLYALDEEYYAFKTCLDNGLCMRIKDSRILSGLFLFLTQQTDRRMIPVHVRKTSRRNAVEQAMINAVIVVVCIPGSVVLWVVKFSDATVWKRKIWC